MFSCANWYVAWYVKARLRVACVAPDHGLIECYDTSPITSSPKVSGLFSFILVRLDLYYRDRRGHHTPNPIGLVDYGLGFFQSVLALA